MFFLFFFLPFCELSLCHQYDQKRGWIGADIIARPEAQAGERRMPGDRDVIPSVPQPSPSPPALSRTSSCVGTLLKVAASVVAGVIAVMLFRAASFAVWSRKGAGRIPRPGDRALLMLSGGIDSVAAMAMVLEAREVRVHAHHIVLVDSQGRWRQELDASRAARWTTAAGPRGDLEYTESVHTVNRYVPNNMEIQRFVAAELCKIALREGDGYAQVISGRNADDISDGEGFRQRARRAQGVFDAMMMHVKPSERPAYEYPLSRMPKAEVVSWLGRKHPKLYSVCWSCRQPLEDEEGAPRWPCGKCEPCVATLGVDDQRLAARRRRASRYATSARFVREYCDEGPRLDGGDSDVASAGRDRAKKNAKSVLGAIRVVPCPSSARRVNVGDEPTGTRVPGLRARCERGSVEKKTGPRGSAHLLLARSAVGRGKALGKLRACVRAHVRQKENVSLNEALAATAQAPGDPGNLPTVKQRAGEEGKRTRGRREGLAGRRPERCGEVLNISLSCAGVNLCEKTGYAEDETRWHAALQAGQQKQYQCLWGAG